MKAADHLEKIVLPAVREFFAAEDSLSAPAQDQSPEAEYFKVTALRRARTASIELNHLADTHANFTQSSLASVRTLISSNCTMLRSNTMCHDCSLLRDIADVFKHSSIDRKSATIKHSKAVVTVSTGYGELGYGEGKFDGTEQIIVELPNGDKRALSSILQNVVDAWRRLLVLSLPPVSEF